MGRTTYPAVFKIIEDLYNQILIPTYNDILQFIQKVAALPIDFQIYLTTLQAEVPTLVNNFVERLSIPELVNKLKTLELYAIALDFYTKVAVPAVSDLTMLFNKIFQITDVYQLRDFIVMDVLSFVNNLLNNISTTDLFSKLMAVFDQVIAAYPDEYDMILKTYKQMTEVTVGNVISAINSYLFEKFGMSFSISAEKFTAVFPLPVNVATVRAYYQMITVYAPAYAIDQGRLVYKYIEAQGRFLFKYMSNILPGIIDYIITQGPIYLQYVVDYVQMIQVGIFNLLELDDDEVEELIDMVFEPLEPLGPYIEQIQVIIFGSEEEAGERLDYYADLFFDNVFMPILEIVFNIKFNIEIYMEFAHLAIEMIMDLAINPVLEHPAIQPIYEYIVNLTPEKAQTDLAPVLDFVMSVLREVSKDITTFIKLHIPFFGLLDYLM